MIEIELYRSMNLGFKALSENKIVSYSIQYKKYQRDFRKPLRTASQRWAVREGIVVRLEDGQGRIGFGEVAPVFGFGGERVEEAEDWLKSLGGVWGPCEKKVPGNLPCCQFAISGALGWIHGDFEVEGGICEMETAGLLPSGEAAIAMQQEMLGDGFGVFKWKIGVGEVREEMEIAMYLAEKGRIRLDANGGLEEAEMVEWCKFLKEQESIEFLEQPLAKGMWRRVKELAEELEVGERLALDEEVTRGEEIPKIRAEGWPGLFVVKSALAGWIGKERFPDAIHSSALETSIGKETALRLAVGSMRCLGFGVGELLEDDGLDLHTNRCRIAVGKVGELEMQNVWERISSC